MLLLVYSKYRGIHSLEEIKACKSNQCFPLCNQPSHNLVSCHTPHFSTQLKSTNLMSILLKLSLQHARVVCRKPRAGLQQMVQQDLIMNLYFIPYRKGNFSCCRIHSRTLTSTLNIASRQK